MDNKNQATTIARLVETDSDRTKTKDKNGIRSAGQASNPEAKSLETNRKKVDLLDRRRELHMLVPGSHL